LAHVRELHDDYYRLEEEQLTLVGESSGRRFRFGDKVKVVITKVDLINLEMDLIPADLAEGPTPRRRRARGGGPPLLRRRRR
jgi:ribonuclease R